MNEITGCESPEKSKQGLTRKDVSPVLQLPERLVAHAPVPEAALLISGAAGVPYSHEGESPSGVQLPLPD
ncbi:MAG: hypothetical protein KJ607_00560 [Bacteroidetes bacterium]|nr:hypothetical protein [Bacteroidota bacterium]